MKRESKFQSELIHDIKEHLPGSYVLKNDGSNVPQGFPDLLVLHKDRWAALECKRSKTASKQPNQEYYVDQLSKMAYASFISPENKEEVLNELYSSFGPDRSTRISRCE